MDKGVRKFVTFNCKSVKRSAHCIRELCKTSDLIALQETWLLPEELSFLDTLSEDFSATGVSAVDTSEGILRGRPYGGVALLWRRSVFSDVSVIECNSPRVCAIKIVIQNKSFIVLSVYMPTDTTVNLSDFTDVLSAVSAIIDTYEENCVYIFGDYNAHPSEPFYNELSQFCMEQKWCCIDTEMLGCLSDTYTFISEAHGSKRWLDHCVVTQAAKHSVRNIYVLYDVFWSDHFPLVIECNIDVLSPRKYVIPTCLNEVSWGERSLEQVNTYQRECQIRLSAIDAPHELRECFNSTCNNIGHENIIVKLYNDIVQILSECSLISRNNKKPVLRKRVIGWNSHVAEAHGIAKQKFFVWHQCGKPTAGRAYVEMCEARRMFKSRLKWCQNHEEQIRMDRLASYHCKNNFKGFWKHTNRMNSVPSLPVSVSGVCETDKIANLFRDHFVVKSPKGPSQSVLNVGASRELGIQFSYEEVSCAIKSMTRGKSPGHDGLSIEHLQYAGSHLVRLLAMMYNICMSHSFMPSEMLRTVVVPIVKNKTGDLSDKNNYRPISLATVISKVFDSLLNAQLNKYFKPHDNQFGFRPGLSTESAILGLKHTVTYYVKRKTPIYACFLDLSKAFELVSYDILWRKLEKINIPPELTNILKYWYKNQVNYVRWAGVLSHSYGLECGVRQGGLSSPTLFNLYVNELLEELSSTRVGCYIDGICTNNISYADDMVLLSASICGLRKLLSLCESYAGRHGLTYNVKKSVFMVFEAEGKTPNCVPKLFLNSKELLRVNSFKYLGHMLTPDLKDDTDIERERRILSVRANMLARRFARCTHNVKITLFKAYCTSFYTCSLWAKFSRKSYNTLRVQYNNSFRVLLGLPRFCSASGMFATAKVDCFYATMRKRCGSLVRRLRGSTNSILEMIAGRLDCTYVSRCCAVSTGMSRL
ncbi:unnamed protein product [Euphydryas editha]|uniref:Reverse transcriptase domain-containing protein n=1 Tax=Euphydryas editha TaxID=104508 RepID=A0AAU9U7B3_EUPED|nr:unnamed protein product [Euphydryas editha]